MARANSKAFFFLISNIKKQMETDVLFVLTA